MAGTKEIRNKIKSVQNTRKITKAMEMVAASKMRRAQERMRAARPFAAKIRNVAANITRANPEYRPPFLVEREVKNVGIILITTDKGLCGGLNTNILRMLTTSMKSWHGDKKDILCTAIGAKGFQFLNRIKAKLVSHATHLGDKPLLDDLIGTIKIQLDAFEKGEVDEIYLCYNRFINTMKQEPVIEKILPLPMESLDQSSQEKVAYGWDYIYEPDAQTVLDDLLKKYIEAIIYQAVSENMASEQSARMVAMKAASDNAKNLIAELQLDYNKTRQAAITKELSEIVSGAAAV
ncbi:ATP synthase gamma chain [Polynucleobacter sp. SHI8]|uniref:F0F1 ATP synthase subunit gamma n=1 Tax=unclassified Polynucleobacter TaxID=2640945 RepID=UPI0024918E61|nr:MULTISPECIES: F0F1 ATP synthase subunit gamma [unclassified Polynucleobacter]BDW09941.1 ATP synthase gamma chain [Polynucleobacter sp. SHI2]BDW12387.1 ATP synthase gamma chain [Polynucleobacter sp. SHI8]